MIYFHRDKEDFLCGKNDEAGARAAARECTLFAEDCEEECVSVEPLSCLNCRYRRWTQESYFCMKGQIV